MILLIYSK